VQSVPITTKLVSSNPVHGKVYSIQLYVIKFVSDLWQVGGLLRILDHEGPKKEYKLYNMLVILVFVNLTNVIVTFYFQSKNYIIIVLFLH
jgi:hypothetical protein